MDKSRSNSSNAHAVALGGTSSFPVGARRDWKKQLRKLLRNPQFWFGAVILLPTVIWYWIFSFKPILTSFWIAGVRYKLLDPSSSPFAGLDNFVDLFAHPQFLLSVRNTISWAVLSFCVMLPLSILISVCLAGVARGRRVYQFIVFIPVVISLVAISLLFKMLMDPDVGQFNRVLNSLGLPSFTWLSDSSTALPTAVMIGVWKGIGFYVVVLTAGMMNIPSELQDAALVDGANEWQRFWKVTLPLLSHTLVLVTVMMIIGGLQEFTLPQLLRGSAGADASLYVLNILIYEEAFLNLHFGIATAAALLQFLFILIVSVIQIKLIQPKWSY